MKKNLFHSNLLPVFTTVFLFLSMAIAQSQEKKICTVELREYPGKDPAMWNGLYAASDGKVYTGLCTEGESAHFYVYDPAKDKNFMLCDMSEFLGERGKGIRSSGKIHNKPVEDNEGNIYFVPMSNGGGPNNIDYTSWMGGHWVKYDPKTNKLENMGLVDKVGCYPLTIDKNRGYLYGIGFTGYFYRFDLKNRITKTIGRVGNWDICRSIFSDDEGNVYMSYPTSQVEKYDSKKERVYETSLHIPYDPTIYPTELRNPQIDRTYIWRAVEWDPIDKVAYGVTCGSGSILFRFDPHDGPQGKITALVKMCDAKFLEGNPQDVPYSPLSFAVDSRNKKVYFAPSARNYSIQRMVETFGSSEEHHLIMYDIKADKRVDLGAMQTTDGRRVFGCEAASVAPDGTVYLCGQAETKDKKVTGRRNDNPLQLIIYKPQQK
jgi:hypothetical protein